MGQRGKHRHLVRQKQLLKVLLNSPKRGPKEPRKRAKQTHYGPMKKPRLEDTGRGLFYGADQSLVFLGMALFFPIVMYRVSAIRIAIILVHRIDDA